MSDIHKHTAAEFIESGHADNDTTIEYFSNEKALGRIWKWQSSGAIVFAMLSVGYMLAFHAGCLKTEVNPTRGSLFADVILCLWSVVPAAWFAIETHWLISRSGKQNKPKRMAEFKVGQDSAKAFWVTIAFLIALLWKG